MPVPCPIIFTTAYNEYALEAFKVNSIDYLLKPIDEAGLRHSLDKLKALQQSNPVLEAGLLQSIAQSINQQRPTYKTRFLIRRSDQLYAVKCQDIAYFAFENRLTYLFTHDGKRHISESVLDELERQLNPQMFFRLNRQCITNIDAIDKVHNHFNGKLKVDLLPTHHEAGFMVSREKAPVFKDWMNM